MTPLEIKLATALNEELVRQLRGRLEQIPVVIDCDKLAQVCTRTIKDAMAATLRAVAAKRAAEVNKAIDEVTQ